MEPLFELVGRALGGPTPHIVGIAGPVAVGKSTVAHELADGLRRAGRRIDIVATDSFLFPNTVLASRDELYRKGFPESFDASAMVDFLSRVKAGEHLLAVPVYSHAIYDIVEDARVVVEDPDVVILEGVVALQSPVVELLDVAVYIDADETDVRRWYVERFVALTEAARSDERSFYRMFADRSDLEVRTIAEGTWDAINGVNLREHIGPSRANATYVVEKAADHSIARVTKN